AQRVAELLVEHGGGQILPGLTVAGEVPVRPAVTMDAALPARVLGVDVSAETVVAALEGNGIAVDLDAATGQIVATGPSWRFDLNDPYDLVEEVLRVVGYDAVPSVLPKAPGGRGLTRAQALRRRSGLALASFGLTEVKSLPFVGDGDFDKLGLAADDARRDTVQLANPLSSEQPALTSTLLIGLLRSTALNVSRGHDDIALFEVARIFQPKHGVEAPIYGVDRRPTEAEYAALNEALPIQPHHASWVMLGRAVRPSINAEGVDFVWSDALAVAHDLARVLNVELTVEAAQYAPFHPGRCAALKLDGQIIGHAGELDPRISQAHGLPGRVMAGEINLDAMFDAAPEVGEKPSFSTFPVAKEDFAFVAPAAVTAGALSELIAGAHEFVESVRLFDIYTGDQVEVGKKSLAYKVRLRAADRTLSDADIKAAREAILAQAETIGAVSR
ncbi:MAG: phenylalanine--tRNA ligase subunit beta, partial [Actinomycetales bacterium]|nr:phenylalanine--tRNA ligase subunit beta [Actinomycetales bacterium]